MKIGLVGEAPNDVQSIKNLLIKKYGKYEFIFMLQRINGSQLDSQKTKSILRKEFQSERPDIVIFIRDLDSVLPNKTKINDRRNYFTDFNSVVNKLGIYLLHIYEIEALILTDIPVFNKIYNTDVPQHANVMLIEEPKEYLKLASKKYNESHNAEIFKELDFEKALDCIYFKLFIQRFNKLLN